MEYKIIEKEAFKVIGALREFHTDTSYQEIPKFWCEHLESGNGKHICGMFGICYDEDRA